MAEAFIGIRSLRTVQGEVGVLDGFFEEHHRHQQLSVHTLLPFAFISQLYLLLLSMKASTLVPYFGMDHISVFKTTEAVLSILNKISTRVEDY